MIKVSFEIMIIDHIKIMLNRSETNATIDLPELTEFIEEIRHEIVKSILTKKINLLYKTLDAITFLF
jgi:hypothetical protein